MNRTLEEVVEDDELSGIIVEVSNPETPFGGVQIFGATDAPIQIVLREGEKGDPGDPGLPGEQGEQGVPGLPGETGSGSGISSAGITPLVVGQDYVDVVFPIAQSNANWNFLECFVVNSVSSAPLNLWAGIVTSKTVSGFRIYLNGAPDNANYYLHWAISGSNIPPVAATTYSLSGPTSGLTGSPSSVFTVALLPSTTVATPVTVTPHDGGAGGTFTPATVMLTTAAPSGVFTYTPVTDGVKTIATTNDGALTNPASITFTASSYSTSYTLTGPSGGTNGVASTNFTVALPVGGSVAGTVTVTPSSGGGGGTFTPTTVALTTAAPSATFTYTPASTGAKTISVTNSGGLTNPANLTYTVSSGAIADGDTVSTWPDSSSHANHGVKTGTPIYKTAILNGKPVVRFTVPADGFNLTTVISGAFQWSVFAVMKADVAKSLYTLRGTTGLIGPSQVLSGGVDYFFTTDLTQYWIIANASQRGAFHVFEFQAYTSAVQSNSCDGTSMSLAGGAGTATGDFALLCSGEGDIAEIVAFSIGYTNPTRQNIIATLGAKYAISVAGGGSVIDLATLSPAGWWKADAIT